MEETKSPLVGACSFAGIKPIMADLPYPPIEAEERNTAYANLLSVDYCGAVSELSAITQYINNENPAGNVLKPGRCLALPWRR